MNLLLLLSALLSAITGVGPSARAPSAPKAAMRLAETERAVAVRPRSTDRPVAGLPSLTAIMIAPMNRSFVTAVFPAWSNRRRE